METVHTIDGPYNFTQALKRLQIDPLLTLNLDEQHIKVPLWVNGIPVTVELTQTGTLEQPAFRIRTDGHPDVTLDDVIDHLSHLLHWHIPLQEVADFFHDKELNRLFSDLRGTPFVCDFQLYGSLMKTIIHQQLNMAFAFTLTERFVKTFGFQQDGCWFYPSPEKVAELDVAELRELQFSTRKAEYVIHTSQMIANGELNLHKLAEEPDENVIKTLVKIRGIGPWTAENFLMFGLGRMDLFPMQDIGIQNAMKKYYEWDAKPSYPVMEEKSQLWTPYRTYASLYLWESIET